MNKFTLQQVARELNDRGIEYEFYESKSYVWAVRFTEDEYQFTVGRPASRNGGAHLSISTPTYRGVSDSTEFRQVMDDYFSSYGVTNEAEDDSYLNQAVRVIDDDDGETFVCRFHAAWWQDDIRQMESVRELFTECFEVVDWMKTNLSFVESPQGHIHFAEPDVDLGFTAFLQVDEVVDR